MSGLRELYVPRDGTFLLRAILVTSVAEGYNWLREHFPGYTWERQHCIATEALTFDLITIRDASGAWHQVWFKLVPRPR